MADTLFDRVIRHQVQIERAKAGEVKTVNKIISTNDKEIIALISSLPENHTQVQLDSLLKKIGKINKNYYKQVVADYLDNVVAPTTVSFETDFAEQTVEKFLSDGDPVSKVSKKETTNKVLKEKYDGHKLSTWVSKLAIDKTKRISSSIKAVPIKDRSASKVLSVSKKAIRNANSNNQSVTKAYVNQSVNVSRDEVYLQNDKFVTEIIWSSILDGGTTITCGVRSNKRYDAKTKEPIGHDNAWNNGPGLIHWGCRSVGIPVNKDNIITSGSGKGFPIDSGSRTAIGADTGYERGDNKKADGKRFKIPSVNNELQKEVVSATTDYETWLKRQPRAFVQDSIGVAKADAFLSGKAKLGDFVVKDGTELSVKQLEKQLKLGND